MVRWGAEAVPGSSGESWGEGPRHKELICPSLTKKPHSVQTTLTGKTAQEAWLLMVLMLGPLGILKDVTVCKFGSL